MAYYLLNINWRWPLGKPEEDDLSLEVEVDFSSNADGIEDFHILSLTNSETKQPIEEPIKSEIMNSQIHGKSFQDAVYDELVEEYQRSHRESSLKKVSFVKHCPGHKNSKGDAAPWCIVSHETGKILSSHKTESEAKAHLQEMHIFKSKGNLISPKEIFKKAVDPKNEPANISLYMAIKDLHFEPDLAENGEVNGFIHSFKDGKRLVMQAEEEISTGWKYVFMFAQDQLDPDDLQATDVIINDFDSYEVMKFKIADAVKKVTTAEYDDRPETIKEVPVMDKHEVEKRRNELMDQFNSGKLSKDDFERKMKELKSSLKLADMFSLNDQAMLVDHPELGQCWVAGFNIDSKGGRMVKIKFKNGDIKEVYPFELKKVQSPGMLKKGHCGPCSPIKLEAIRQLSDLYYKDKSLFSEDILSDLAIFSSEEGLINFASTLEKAIHGIEAKPENGDLVKKLKQIHASLLDIQNKLEQGIFEVVDKEDMKVNAVSEIDMYPGSYFKYLDDMREWLKELSWANMELEDFDRLSPEQIIRGIDKYYAGGKEQFMRDSIPVKANTIPYNGNRPQDWGVDPEEEEGEGYGGDRPGIAVEPKEGSSNMMIPEKCEICGNTMLSSPNDPFKEFTRKICQSCANKMRQPMKAIQPKEGYLVKAAESYEGEEGHRQHLREVVKDTYLEKPLEQALSNFNAFSVAAGLYWYLSDSHGGQWSEEYAMLSKLDYRPGASDRSPEENGENEEDLWAYNVFENARPQGKKSMKAVLKDNLGTLKKGEILVLTGFKKDKAFFFVEKDPSLVGVIAKVAIEPYSLYLKREAAVNFLKCHKIISKSPEFVKKMAADFFGLINPAVLDQLNEIKDDLAINRDEFVNSIPTSPINESPSNESHAPVIPAIHANIRLRDAAQFFSLKNVIPTEQDTVNYIKSSMSAHYGLPETVWSDDIVKKAIMNRKAEEPLDWSNKMMLMMQWHMDYKLPGSMWNELQRLTNLSDLNEVRTGINLLFDEASRIIKNPAKSQSSQEKISVAPPPKPTDPTGPNEEFILDPATNTWIKQIKQSSQEKKNSH